MSEIRTTKIDGVEFVTYKDYLRLKEEKEKIELLFKRRKFEGNNGVKEGKWLVRVFGELGNKPMVELESFQIVVKQNQKLEEENQKLKEAHKSACIQNNELDRINHESKKENRKLEEENKKLKDELKERNKLIRDIVLNFHRIDENKILELLLKLPTE